MYWTSDNSEKHKPIRYCANCGQPISEGAKFCTHCGRQLETADYYSYPNGNYHSQPITHKESRAKTIGCSIAGLVLSILCLIYVLCDYLAFLFWGPERNTLLLAWLFIISLVFGLVGFILGFVSNRSGEFRMNRVVLPLSLIGSILSLIGFLVALL